MPRDSDSTQVEAERKYDDAITRRDKDDQKQQAHDAKKQSKSHDVEIREARQHESELRDRFFHTDYSERTGLSPADRLAKMSHDATLISEERAKAAKLVEQDESAEFWEKEHAIQAAHTSPKGQKKTISAKHDEIIPSSKISHSASKPDEVGVQETAIDAIEQVPQGPKQKQWEKRFPDAAPQSVKAQTGDQSNAIPQDSPLQQQSAPEPKKQQLWSFTKTNAGSLDQHDEDHPGEGKKSKLDRASSKPKEVGVQEDAVDAKEQVPKGRKQKDVEPRDKLEDDADDSSAWPPQESKAMRRAMKAAQAQMRESGITVGAGSQTAVDMAERLKREKISLDKTMEYRQKEVLPNVEEWHADADNHPSVRDRETFREQVGHVADSIMHPFSHSKTDETTMQRPLASAPVQQKISVERHSTSKPDEVGVQEEAIDAKEQVPKGRKQQKWEAQSPEAAPKSVKANAITLQPTHSFRDRIEHVTDRIIHPFSHNKTDESISRPVGVNVSHTMSKPDEVGVQEEAIDAKEIVPQGRKQQQWEARFPEAAPKSVKLNDAPQRTFINTDGPGAKEHEVQVDASPSGVHLKGASGEKSSAIGLIDRIEDKLESWKDEAGSKLSDLKHRIQGDAEVAKDKSVELKDRAETKAADLKDRAVDRGEYLRDRAREQRDDLKGRFDARKESWSADLKRKESDLQSKEASLKSKARDLKDDVVEDVNAVGAKIGAIKDKAADKIEEIGAEIKKEVGDFGSELKKGTSSIVDKFSNKKGDEMDPIIEIQRERELEKSRGLAGRRDFVEPAGKWSKGTIDRDNKAHEPSTGLFSRLTSWWSPKSRSAQVAAERDARIESMKDDSKPDWPDARRTTQWERDNAINQSLLEPDRMQAQLDELRTTEISRSNAPAGGQDSKWNPKHTFAGDIRSSLSSKWSNLKQKTGEPAEEALPDDTRTWGSSAAPSSPSTPSPSPSSFSQRVSSAESTFERHFTSAPHPSSFSPSLSDVTPSTGPSIISYRSSSPKRAAYTEKVVLAEQPRYMQPVDFDAIAFDAAIEPW